MNDKHAQVAKGNGRLKKNPPNRSNEAGRKGAIRETQKKATLANTYSSRFPHQILKIARNWLIL